MKFLGVFFLVIGVILEFVRRGNAAKLLSIKSANSTSIKELLAIARHIADELGSGNLREYVKLQGKIVCAEPLRSELKQEPCVYYNMSVTRIYEVPVVETDEEGNAREKLVRHEERVTNNTRMISFLLDDGTGTLRVDPVGSTMETIQVASELREHLLGGEARGGEGDYDAGSGSAGSKTLGYRHEEVILPIDTQVFVVGTAVDAGGEVTLRQPVQPNQKSDQKFLISLQNEDALAKATMNAANGAKWAMAVCLGIGSVLLVVGLATGR
jgi:hypothetical protein